MSRGVRAKVNSPRGWNNSAAGSKARLIVSRTYCFDIDGTLCSNTEGDYASARPYHQVIAAVNRLYREGHSIILHTARGSMTGIDWHDLTVRQLKKWRVQYHTLYMGKPTADVYIDDKAVNVTEWKRCGFRLGEPCMPAKSE